MVTLYVMQCTVVSKHYECTGGCVSVCVIGPEEALAEYSTFVAAAHRENKQMIRTVNTDSNADTIRLVSQECRNAHFVLAHTMLSDEEDITLVSDFYLFSSKLSKNWFSQSIVYAILFAV